MPNLNTRNLNSKSTTNTFELPWYLKVNNTETVWKRKAVGRGKGSFATIFNECIDQKHPALKNKILKTEACKAC